MRIGRKLAAVAIFVLLLAGCSGQPNTETIAEKAEIPELKDMPMAERTYRAQPPLPKVTAGTTEIPVVQDSYCWDYLGCRDYVGGKTMYNGQALTSVAPGEDIQILLDYQPQPSKVNVAEIKDDNSYEAVPLSEGGFAAPKESGVYYYTYFATWTTADGKYTLNQTSAVFAVEIQ